MGDFDDTFVQDVKVQTWSLFSICMVSILLRFYAKLKRIGAFEKDDYVMLVTTVLYTTLIVSLNAICQGGGSNLYPPELAGTFTKVEIQDRIYGSKIVIVSEQAMLNVIYSIKACMLIMYTRMTLGLVTQRMVRYLAWYVLIGWVATETAFFTACRPFSGYWAMPPPDPECTTLQKYSIVQGCFNITSDLLMLGIPIPLILRVNVHWRQKIMLLSIFSMGGFIIIAALLTKIFNLTNVWDPSYMLWYTREASVAIYVANIPVIWPLLREWFPWMRHLYSVSSNRPSARPGQGGTPVDESTVSRHKRGFLSSFGGHTTTNTTNACGGGGGHTWNSRTAAPGGCAFRHLRSASMAEMKAHDVEMGIPGAGAGAEGWHEGGAGGCTCDGSSSMERILVHPALAGLAGSVSPSLSAQLASGPGAGMNKTEVHALEPNEGTRVEIERDIGVIHVERTVEIRAEARDRSPSIVALDSEEGGAHVYNWERSGIFKHHAAVYTGS